MVTATDNKDPKPLVGTDRRRGKRIPLSFQVEVTGFDCDGRSFCDQTVTADVSAHGCRFDLLRELRIGNGLLVRLASRDGKHIVDSKPLAFEVAWTEPNTRGWTIGAVNLQHENIWHIGFPPQKSSKISLG